MIPGHMKFSHFSRFQEEKLKILKVDVRGVIKFHLKSTHLLAGGFFQRNQELWEAEMSFVK